MAEVIPHRYALLPVADLKPHPDNPNVGDPKAIGESIDALGFYGAVLVQESTGRIMAGEHRWRAAQLRGLAELPALVIDCDDETAEKIMVGDNQYARLGTWDMSKLAEVLTRIAGDGLDGAGLAGTGFTDADLAKLLDPGAESTGELLDLIDVALADPRHQARPGDIWQLGPHVLVVEPVTTGWPAFAPYLRGDAILAAHPSAYAPLAVIAQTRPLVLVQPETLIASHMLDMWAAVHGQPEQVKAGPP
jgi:ParB-like nuclease family protein